MPLVGGSGGAGGTQTGSTVFGEGGGGGGGAILIASSAAITVTGSVRAQGGSVSAGSGPHGGGGAGGGIRLVAPTLTIGGSINVAGGTSPCGQAGGTGRIRLETFDPRYTGGSFTGTLSQGTPYGTFVPAGPPTDLLVISVAGAPVTQTAGGGFAVDIAEPGPTVVTIEARQVPAGTVVDLHLLFDDGTYQRVQSQPLQGTTALSTTTATVTFPPGVTRGYPRAVW